MSQNKLFRLIFVVLFAFLLFRYLPRVKFENSLERWIPESSKVKATYKEFLKKFKGDTLLVIAFRESDDLEQEEVKRQIVVVQKQIRALPHVSNVFDWPFPLFRLKRYPSEKTYSFIVAFPPPSHLNPNRPELLEKIENILEKIPVESHIAGTGVIHRAINEETRRSTILFLSMGILVLSILLFVILKRLSAFLLTIGISLGGVCTLLLSSAILNIPLSMISIILPVLTLFYGASNSLHILFHNGNFKKVFMPCFVATLTTCISFFVFLADPIPVLRDFAVLAMAGILGGLLWAFIFFFPWFYFYVPRGNLTKRFYSFPTPSRLNILLLFVGFLLVLIPGVTRLKSEIYSLSVLSPSNQSVLDHQFIERHVGNYIPLEFTVEIDKANDDAVNRWISYVLAFREVNGTLSYLDFPSSLDPRQYGYVSEDNKLGRITFLIPLLSTTQGISLVKRIDSLGLKILGMHKPEITGYVTLYASVADELKKSFLKSLFLAFIFVFIIILVYFRSFRLFVASLLPNIFPILAIVGMMGWLRIPLDMVTVPIGCLLLGIIVDDTIHFLYWYKKTGDLRKTFIEAGPGICFTTFILAIGFVVFLISSAPPVRYFGILSITALVSALISDFVLLPVILKLTDKERCVRYEQTHIKISQKRRI
jgi:predicted RND superfamily exporter protein